MRLAVGVVCASIVAGFILFMVGTILRNLYRDLVKPTYPEDREVALIFLGAVGFTAALLLLIGGTVWGLGLE